MKGYRLPLALILILLAAIIWIGWFSPESHKTLPIEAELPQTEGGDFVVDSLDGPVLLKDLRGKVVVLYFGYTWCPDICPTSLSYTAAAFEQLSPQERDRVQGIFISVDPDRDTLERLKEYGLYFHPQIIGTTATADRIAAIAKRYGASYRKVEQQSATDYVVDHSAESYLIATDGRLVERLSHGTPPALIVEALRRHLSNP